MRPSNSQWHSGLSGYSILLTKHAYNENFASCLFVRISVAMESCLKKQIPLSIQQNMDDLRYFLKFISNLDNKKTLLTLNCERLGEKFWK